MNVNQPLKYIVGGIATKKITLEARHHKDVLRIMPPHSSMIGICYISKWEGTDYQMFNIIPFVAHLKGCMYCTEMYLIPFFTLTGEKYL